jgi:hypothetical protein
MVSDRSNFNTRICGANETGWVIACAEQRTASCTKSPTGVPHTNPNSEHPMTKTDSNI